MTRALWWIIPVLAVLAGNGGVFMFFAPALGISYPFFSADAFAAGCFIAFLILLIANAAQAAVMAARKPRGYEQFACRAALVVKIGLAPLYAIGSSLLGLIFIFGMLASVELLALMPVILLVGCLGLAAGGSWAALACFGGWKCGGMSDSATVALSVLGFVYPFDLVAAIIACCMVCKEKTPVRYDGGI